MTDGNRKCHLDVGQRISTGPIAAESFHVLLSGQRHVVIATIRDVCWGNARAETYLSIINHQ